MVKLYKNTNPGGNGSFVVVTDEVTVGAFLAELAGNIVLALQQFPGDEEFTLHGVLEQAVEIAFKLQGYKAERVHVQQLLVCGHSPPDECTLVTGEH